jgi:hypothetical protein
MTERENFYKWIESCPQNELDAIAECYGFDSNLNRERAIGCMHEALRRFGRPKPPSLKEQALEALQFVDEKLDLPLHNHCNAIHTIRRALEALDD